MSDIDAARRTRLVKCETQYANRRLKAEHR